MPLPFDGWIHRPIPLEPVERTMPWGSETWLNGTQDEGLAAISGEKGLTLAELLKERPEALGRWVRLLCGDSLPIFTKFLRTRFPPLVHAGFCRSVERGAFLLCLQHEQACLRRLHGALSIPDETAFREFQGTYERWAIAEALGRWRSEDTAPGDAFAALLRILLRPDTAFDLSVWMADVKKNRALIVETLNEVNLEKESGNLLLMSAGLPHSIFGLSHQTHPLDRSRQALQALLGSLRRMTLSGASEVELTEAVHIADLVALRSLNTGPPKNEAWMPVHLDRKLVLVEPQQSSNVTYSFADFYTPFTWKKGLVFRKGDAAQGLSNADLDRFTRELDFTATPVEQLRRHPKCVETAADSIGAEAFALVDEPETWPFFTAYEIRLSGSPGRPARWPALALDGAFVQLVGVEGLLRVEGGFDPVHVDPWRPAFIPATLEGPWALVSEASARVLLFSVPVPRPKNHG